MPVGVLVDAHQREAQIGLARVALGIERNQRATDAPGEQRAAERIGERAPDHVARDHEAAIADVEHHLRGEHPEHADEADEQQRRLQQADRKRRRELGQVLRVLVDALVRIDPDLAGEAQQVGALGREPLVEQVVGQPFPQPDLDHFLQPGLGHDQHEQAAGDDQEDEELGHEGRHVLLLDRVVEGALPDVEPDLPSGIGADHDDDRDRQEDQPVTVWRGRKARSRVRSWVTTLSSATACRERAAATGADLGSSASSVVDVPLRFGLVAAPVQPWRSALLRMNAGRGAFLPSSALAQEGRRGKARAHLRGRQIAGYRAKRLRDCPRATADPRLRCDQA